MSHFKDRITPIHVCWQLYCSGVSPETIPSKIDVHRATVYRWISGMKKKGFHEFLEDYSKAKKGRRNRKISPHIKEVVFEIRNEYKDCCGQKIKYILKRDYAIDLAVSSIYRILHKKYELRSKWKKYLKRGPALTAVKPREVLQVDTVDFGNLFAFTSIDIFTKEVSVVMKKDLDSTAGKEALRTQLGGFGKIEKIQRDGGPEFKDQWSNEAAKRGIFVRTSRPYKKNDQAYIERFNGVLRKECLGYSCFKKSDLEIVQKRVDEFLIYYHTKRPHMSLNMQTPKEFSMSHLT